jgi:hypothetical protein
VVEKCGSWTLTALGALQVASRQFQVTEIAETESDCITIAYMRFRGIKGWFTKKGEENVC